MGERVVIVIFLNLALFGLVPNVDASHFYGVQLAVDMFQNTTGGPVTVDVHWREIWNSATKLSTSSTVNCMTKKGCPTPSSITMDAGTSNCQQTVKSASGVSYDSRTGTDTTMSFAYSKIPTTQFPFNSTYYSMAFSSAEWGLIQSTRANFGAQIDMLLNRRNDTGTFDGSARSAIAPIVTIRPVCNGTGFQIPYYDPEGDPVKCRWANTTLECQGVCKIGYVTTIPFTLSTGCYLTYTGTNPASSVYLPIAVMLEDYYPSMPTTKMDSAPLQFVVEVATANSPCVPITPLVVDICSLAMAPVAVCPSNITNPPANSYVSTSYYTILPNSTANLTCNYGYTPLPTTQIYMICLPKNATAGVWIAVGNCIGTKKRLMRTESNSIPHM